MVQPSKPSKKPKYGQIVPIDDSARLTIKLLKRGTLKTYPGLPHGMCTTHAETINADLLAFIQG